MSLNWDAQTLVRNSAGELIRVGCTPVTSVVTDSRTAEVGSLYVARVGEASDGHDFIPQAYQAGARSFLVSKPEKALELLAEADDCTIVAVADPTLALGQLARVHLAALRAQQDLTVIGITGSAGKTTTKDLLARLLATRAETLAPIGSFNNEVGMPLTVLKADADTRYLILEMGASAIGEIAYLTQIAPVDIAVELIVGRAHLGGFGSREQVAQAKAELLQHAPQAVLNANDELVRQMPGAGERFFFGIPEAAASDTTPTVAGCPLTVYATDIHPGSLDRFAFILHTPSGHAPVELGLSGRHNVSNALAAAAVAHLCGMDVAQIAAVLSGATAASAHRLHVFPYAFATIIDDSYNANPESMRAALASAKAIHEEQTHPGEFIAVLGEMLELGPQARELHREIGDLARSSGVSYLISVGENACYTSGEAQADFVTVTDAETGMVCKEKHVTSAATVADLVRDIVGPGDTVLLKGSNGSRVWQVADQLEAQASNGYEQE